MPRVSVIIPNYNHALYLQQRIDSVLQQTYTDFEVIILDDCSTDNSIEIIESYRNHPKVSKILCNDANSGGPFSQWEKGINTATGSWIWIAESDDFAHPQFLDTLLRLADENKNANIVFCGSNWVDADGKAGKDLSIHQQSFTRTGANEIKGWLSRQCTIQNVSSAIFKKDPAVSAIVGLNQFKACGDWIFYTRMLQQADIVFTAQKLNNFRWYHNNLSQSAQSNNYWLTEGIKVLDNISLKKVRFGPADFLRTVKFWTGQIRQSKQSGKQQRPILINFIKRYLKLIKA